MKIFINDKPLVFSDTKVNDDFVLLNADVLYKTVVELFDNDDCKGAIVKTNQTETAFKSFCNQFFVLEAAGGVVFNDEKEILLIERLGKWDLPKGKIERIETPKHAAMREVCEETGVCDLEVLQPLPHTYHTYEHKGRIVLKRTYWFIMQCNSFANFILQKEEDITNAKWMDKEEIKKAMKNSYASINELMQNVV